MADEAIEETADIKRRELTSEMADKTHQAARHFQHPRHVFTLQWLLTTRPFIIGIFFRASSSPSSMASASKVAQTLFSTSSFPTCLPCCPCNYITLRLSSTSPLWILPAFRASRSTTSCASSWPSSCSTFLASRHETHHPSHLAHRLAHCAQRLHLGRVYSDSICHCFNVIFQKFDCETFPFIFTNLILW